MCDNDRISDEMTMGGDELVLESRKVNSSLI